MTNRKSSRYIISLAQFVSSLAFSCSLTFIPLFVRTLGVTELNRIAMWSAVLDTASGLVMALSSPLWGMVSDRRGRKPIVLRGMWGSTVVFAAVLLAKDVEQLLTIFVLKGLFSGIQPAAASLMASVTTEQDRGKTFGLLELAASGGMALGPVLGGFVAESFGYRSTYALSSILFALAGTLVAIMAGDTHHPAARSQRKASSVGVGTSVLGVLRGSGQPGLVLLVMFLVRCGRAVIKPVLPLLVQSLQGGEGMVAISTGTVVGVTQFFTALAAVKLGRVGDRVGHRNIATLSALLASALYFLQFIVRDTLTLILVRTGLGVALGGVLPATNALLASSVPPDRQGVGYGLLATIFACGNMLGPLLGAGVAAGFGLSQPFILSGVFLATAGLVIWVGFRARPRVCKA